MFINRRWCRIFTYSLFHLGPPTFRGNYPQLFVTVTVIVCLLVYIHPEYTIFKVTQELQSISPDSSSFIMGDFNHFTVKERAHYQVFISISHNLLIIVKLLTCLMALSRGLLSLLVDPRLDLQITM